MVVLFSRNAHELNKLREFLHFDHGNAKLFRLALFEKLRLVECLDLLFVCSEWVDKIHFIQLIRRAELIPHLETRLENLPRIQTNVIGWLGPLILDAGPTYIEDPEVGLSELAQGELAVIMRRVVSIYPWQVFLLTRDVVFAQKLGSDAYLFAEERFWQLTTQNLNDGLMGAVYLIGLRSTAAVDRFLKRITRLTFVRSAERISPTEARVAVAAAERIAELNWAAGFDLISFQYEGGISKSEGQMPPDTGPPIEISELLPPRASSERVYNSNNPFNRLKALLLLAAAEWRVHFRSLWGWGNLIILSLVPLVIMQYFLTVSPDTQALPRYLPFSILSLSALPLVLSTERANCLYRNWADASTNSSARARRHTIGRGTALAGIWSGQIGLFALYSWPLGFLLGILPAVVAPPIIAFWLMNGLASLCIAFGLGRMIKPKGAGYWIGGLVYAAVISISYGLTMVPAEPWIWLWPFTGLAEAGHRVLIRSNFWEPLLFGVAGLAALAAWANTPFLAVSRLRRKKRHTS